MKDQKNDYNDAYDYRTLSLSLKGHPLSFLRQTLTAKRIVAADALRDIPAAWSQQVPA